MTDTASQIGASAASRPPMGIRYDEELRCFILFETGQNAENIGRELAFCQKVNVLAESGEIFASRLKHFLESLTCDRQFHGSTLRIGVCANPSINFFVDQHLSTSLALSESPKVQRATTLKSISRENVLHTFNAGIDDDEASTINYEYFIIGTVPLKSTDVSYERQVLKEFYERAVSYLSCAEKWSTPLTHSGYEKLVESILYEQNSQETDTKQNSYVADTFTTPAAYSVRIIPIELNASESAFCESQIPLFDCTRWKDISLKLHPKHFMVTAIYRIVDQEISRKELISRRSRSKFRKIWVTGQRRKDFSLDVAHSEKILNLMSLGESVIELDARIYGFGASSGEAEEEARKFVRSIRSTGFDGICEYEGPKSVETILPLATLQGVGGELVDTARASVFAPTISFKVVRDRDGLPLFTPLGQPTVLDFLPGTTAPVTVITGGQGSDASKLSMTIILHCLSRRLPVFAIGKQHKHLVDRLNGQYISLMSSQTKGLFPFNLRQNSDNSATISAIFLYLMAIHSLFGTIDKHEKLNIEQWLHQHLVDCLRETNSNVGVNIARILYAMQSDGLQARQFLHDLKDFGFGGKYEHYLDQSWDTALSRDEFTVMEPLEKQDSKSQDNLRVAYFLTLMAVGRNMFDRPDKRTAAALVFEDADDVLSSTEEVNRFIHDFIHLCNNQNCAIVWTVKSPHVLCHTPGGLKVSRWARNMIALPQESDMLNSRKYRTLFGVMPWNERLFQGMYNVSANSTEMMIKSLSLVGKYQLRTSSNVMKLIGGEDVINSTTACSMEFDNASLANCKNPVTISA
jgi:hypothetical protein